MAGSARKFNRTPPQHQHPHHHRGEFFYTSITMRNPQATRFFSWALHQLRLLPEPAQRQYYKHLLRCELKANGDLKDFAIAEELLDRGREKVAFVLKKYAPRT